MKNRLMRESDIKERRILDLVALMKELGRECSSNDPLWDMFCESHFGNQQFANDSYFRWMFASLNGEVMNTLEQELYDICNKYGAVQNDEALFWVSW